MAQGVQCLLRKFEDLSPDPRKLSKAGYGSMQSKPKCSHAEKDTKAGQPLDVHSQLAWRIYWQTAKGEPVSNKMEG